MTRGDDYGRTFVSEPNPDYTPPRPPRCPRCPDCDSTLIEVVRKESASGRPVPSAHAYCLRRACDWRGTLAQAQQR